VSIGFPGESADYRAARDRLLAQEIELRRATEEAHRDEPEFQRSGGRWLLPRDSSRIVEQGLDRA
jgi:hypothetical protein